MTELPSEHALDASVLDTVLSLQADDHGLIIHAISEVSEEIASADIEADSLTDSCVPLNADYAEIEQAIPHIYKDLPLGTELTSLNIESRPLDTIDNQYLPLRIEWAE